MKLWELFEDSSVATTVSGSIAPVAAPLGQVIKRIPDGNMFAGFVSNDLTPNTPAEYKKYKRKK
jgi:hypothetical protein